MGTKKMLLVATLAVLAMAASACTIDVERNDDGSLQVSSVMTAESLAAEFESDARNDNVTVEIRDGFMLVDAEGHERNGDEFVASFRADLGLADETLTVDISDAVYNGWDVSDDIVQRWDDAIADALNRAAREHPNATLTSVAADDGQIELEMRIETRESRGQ